MPQITTQRAAAYGPPFALEINSFQTLVLELGLAPLWFCLNLRLFGGECFPVSLGGVTRKLPKLSAEMLHICITAKRCDLGNFMRTKAKLFLGQPNPAMNDILHAGDTEGGFVYRLQIACADMQMLCH